ncbi:hypothetical protein HHK36_006406 [Tetracentron sinense]|uniref:Pentatricopeptide repeat-containing protein n=1 Tax=Tetracentron sinense TaxID=13715 RepID=A0A834ZH73_TETSI|nr:hypothetical protein HHK36_006406 [Tetracentron sinense]
MNSFSVTRKKTPFQKHREEEEAKKKRAEDETARLYAEFLESFQGDNAPGSKAFVRGGTINPNEKLKTNSEGGNSKDGVSVPKKGSSHYMSLVLKSGSEDFKLVGSSLFNFYSTFFEIKEARQENAGLRCHYMEHIDFRLSKNECGKALELFRSMRQRSEVRPNEFSIDSVVRACGRLGALHQGKIVHGLLIGYGFESDFSIGGALIDFYSCSDSIEDAKRVFDRLASPCLNVSNTLIRGLISMVGWKSRRGFSREWLKQIQCHNLMIKGYAMSGRIEDSRRLFEEIPQRTIVSSNTMISVYSRNGELSNALKLFKGTKGKRNTVTWNSMMSA